jgi:hypothetical protein
MDPSLRFLDDMDICFRGHGSQLIFKISLVSIIYAPISCWLHSFTAAVGFGRQLRRAAKAVQAGGVAKDPWLQHSATKVADDDGCMVEN